MPCLCIIGTQEMATVLLFATPLHKNIHERTIYCGSTMCQALHYMMQMLQELEKLTVY